MKTPFKLLNTRATLLVVIGFSGLALGQSMQGVSDIYYDQDADRIEALGVTTADYSSAYYYQLETQSSLSGGGQYATASGYDSYNSGFSWTDIVIEPSSDVSATYTAMSSHFATVTYTTVELGF